MTWWHRLWRRAERERQLDAELRYHVERRVDDLVQGGLSAREARRAVRLEFGGLDQVKEQCRDARGTRWIEDAATDLPYAARLLATRRSFTLVAALVLALGIGVNAMFLTLVEMICIRGLPIDRADRVMFVRDAGSRVSGLSYADFEAVRGAAPAFSGLAAFAGASMAISDEGRAADRVSGAYVSAGAFGLVGEPPIAGRDFRAEDDRPGAPAVVIIGSRVWRGRYESDPAVVGRTIRVNGVPSVVIGVMRERFRFPTNADVWLPLALMPGLATEPGRARTLGVFGRLLDEATAAEARDQVAAVAARLERDSPDTNTGVRLTVQPINERYNGDITNPAWLAFVTAGGLVLLIACANVANLLLMRSTERSREIAMRASLGATRQRVVRQLLAESALLAIVGGALGIGLGVAGLRLIASFVPPDALPYWMDFTMDMRVLGTLAAICLATSFIFGLVPAFHLARTDVYGVLKDGSRAAGSGMRRRAWGAIFLTGQVALALLLLTQLALSVDLSLEQGRRDPPIDMPHLLTMSVALPAATYRTPDERAAFDDRLDQSVRAIGAVSSVAIASALPFGGGAPRQLAIEGVPDGPDGPATVWTLGIGSGYFETLGLSLVHGRALGDRDGTPGYESVIVNQRFAELFFPDADPLGRRIRLTAAGETARSPWLTIVGVSPTVRQRLLPDPDPVVYLPYPASPPASAFVLIRGRREAESMAPSLREVVRRLDPDLPLYAITTLEQAVEDLRWNSRLSSLLISIITCIAVGLAAVGLYTVTSHAVAARTQELGVRMALGAGPRHLGWLVLRRATAQLGAGLFVGALCALAWEGLFASGSPSGILDDPGRLVAAATVLVLVAATACLVPLSRVTRLDPVVALRHE